MTTLEAMQRLAVNPRDPDAVLDLYENIRPLIGSVVAVHFGAAREAGDAHFKLLYRIAGRAKHYPNGIPLDAWLVRIADIECLRIQNESFNREQRSSGNH